MDFWKRLFGGLLDRVIALAKRYPGTIAAFGFVSGIVSFFTVERHEAFARGIALVMLASWVWLVVENTVRERIAQRFGVNVPVPLLRYVTQMIHQEGLFFVLPFLYTSTTWLSGQAVFTGLVGLAALAALVDPFYNHWLSPRRWVFLAYHAFTLFAVLLTALPLVLRLPTETSYLCALGITVLLACPTLFGLFGAGSILAWRRWPWMAALMLALAAMGWSVRHWVPPSTLWLAASAVTPSLDARAMRPGPDQRIYTVNQLGANGIYAYTSISAPLGLHEHVYHVWKHNGQEMLRVPLDIQVGLERGFRAWSHKQNFGADPVGDWRVEVETDNGQIVGVLRFRIEASLPVPE